MKRLPALAIAALVGLLPALAQPAPSRARLSDTLAAFYGWVLAHPGNGVPGPGDRDKLATVLSPDLIGLLGRAAKAERACVKHAAKDEKPLIVEGDLFTGVAEGATEVAYGPEQLDDEDASIEVTLVYVDRRLAKAHRHRAITWTNRVALRADGSRWVIADIRYADGESLKETLEKYLAAAAAECR